MSMLMYGTEKFSRKFNITLTVTWMIVTWGLSVLFPSIDKVLQIMGGLCASTLDYALPMFCFVKLSEQKWTSCKNLSAILVFSTMTLIGYISVGITIFLAATGCETMRDYNAGKC